jgi:hypothetical protein
LEVKPVVRGVVDDHRKLGVIGDGAKQLEYVIFG